MLPIDRDLQRFRDIVKGRVRKELRRYMSSGELVGRKGNDTVSIPIHSIGTPRLRHGDNKKGVGQGDGDGDGPGEGQQAGDAEGQHVLETELTIEELAEILGEELQLPRIQPKGQKDARTSNPRYTGISVNGPESLRHFKRTWRRALRRTMAGGEYVPERPIVVPIKAVVMNVASVAASFGALVWVFQDGHFASALGFEVPGGIDLTVPIILFSVVFGLSMDYEVFLLARIREEYLRTGDDHEAIALGLERTGSLITRAALLLVVVVVGFAAGEFLFVQELGVGMVLAILLDATLVRALLVPSTMAMLGHWNWWAPAPLARLWVRMGGRVVGH